LLLFSSGEDVENIAVSINGNNLQLKDMVDVIKAKGLRLAQDLKG